MPSSCSFSLIEPQGFKIEARQSSVLLVEDELPWQKAFTSLLEGEQGFKLIGLCSNYEAALRLYQAHQPEWVLLDWHIQGEPDGLALASELLRLGHPAERLVLVSGSDTSEVGVLPYRQVSKAVCATDLLPLLRESFSA